VIALRQAANDYQDYNNCVYWDYCDYESNPRLKAKLTQAAVLYGYRHAEMRAGLE